MPKQHPRRQPSPVATLLAVVSGVVTTALPVTPAVARPGTVPGGPTGRPAVVALASVVSGVDESVIWLSTPHSGWRPGGDGDPFTSVSPSPLLRTPWPPSDRSADDRTEPPPTDGTMPVAYIPPVDAPVTDPFRPPAGPYGPGNRGIEYATVPGSDVIAAADGVVTFAGSVAGALYVTILHADGIRTTVSYVATVRVAAGEPVARGQLIASAGPVTHVSARLADEYIDPATLWGSGPSRVFLVPLDGG